MAWSVYIGTDDADALGRKVEAAGGHILAPAFDVGEQGRMAVFADPGGAAISVWQPIAMHGFQTEGANAYSWAELNARNVGASLPFYRDVFGWALHASDSPGHALHRVPGRRHEHRRRDGDEPDGTG